MSATRQPLGLHLVTALALGAAAISVTGCTQDDPPKPPGQSDPDPGDSGGCTPPCFIGDEPPAPWNTLTWTFTQIDGGDPTKPAGIQGRLLRGNDGTLFYAYLKVLDPTLTCTIAAFGIGVSPMPRLDLKVAVRAPAADTWTVETVDFSGLPAPSFPTSRFGIDGTLDSSGRPVFVLAAGDPGLAQCGSTDAVRATRTGANAWQVQAVASNSGHCCTVRDPITAVDQLDYCGDVNCTNAGPGDVGAWSAIARSESGNLAIAFTDHHNYWDQDGQNHQGYEIWIDGGIRGVRPWSGMGNFAALAFVGNTPVTAFTGYKTNGLTVLRRGSNNNDGNDWLPADETVDVGALFRGWAIGERIRMAVAPDGTLGLAFHAKADRNGIVVNDLFYCVSPDAGVTWLRPCRRLGQLDHLGGYPGLTYDADNVPYLSYYNCGPNQECNIRYDGLRFAWWDESELRWWEFAVHGDALTSSGLYTDIAVDPTTKEPTIVYHNQTHGTAVVAQGRFN